MGDASYGNAMTEIALALAMAFFAIMVLTMVSMGAPAETVAKAAAPAPVKLTLAPPAPNAPPSDAAEETEIVVFWDGRFYDQDLKPVTLAARRFTGRVILALSPELSMAEALDARGRVPAADIVVSTLDSRWLATIRQAIGHVPDKE